VNAVFANDVR
jgi:hypothetical protein